MSDHKMSLRGDKAAVRWQDYNAAGIEGYTATRRRDGRYDLRARVKVSDSYRMRQRPLSFVAEVCFGATRVRPAIKASYIWPIHEFDLNNGVLKALLGSPIGPPQW